MARTTRTQANKTALGTTRAKTVRRPRTKAAATKAAAPRAEPAVEQTASPLRSTSPSQTNGTVRSVVAEPKPTQPVQAPPVTPKIVPVEREATVSPSTAHAQVGAARSKPKAAPRAASRQTPAAGSGHRTTSAPSQPKRPDIASLPTTIMQVGRAQAEQNLALGQALLGVRSVPDLMALQMKCVEQTVNHAFAWVRLSTAIMSGGLASSTKR